MEWDGIHGICWASGHFNPPAVVIWFISRSLRQGQQTLRVTEGGQKSSAVESGKNQDCNFHETLTVDSWRWTAWLINVINSFPISFERGIFFPPILAIKQLDWLLARLTLVTGSQGTNCRFCYISFAAKQLNFIHHHFRLEAGLWMEGAWDLLFKNPRFDSLPTCH